MKFILHSLILSSVLCFLLTPLPTYGRRKTTDSIMDIINTRHVERTIAERRLNASREERRMLTQNDLEDDFANTETPPLPQYYQPPEFSIDLDMNTGRHHQQQQSNRPMDILMRYNDTLPYAPLFASHSQQDVDLLSNLQLFQSDKLLKSSKNALFVTRKEYLKKDWCKTEPLVQRIREDGCLSRNIINRFCYGQCNSFYIPKSPKRSRTNRLKRISYNSVEELEPEDLTGAAFRSCAFCKPKKFTWITITLRCPSLVPQIRRKKIQRIKQCKCVAEPLD